MKLTIRHSVPTGNRRRSFLSSLIGKPVKRPFKARFAIDRTRSQYDPIDSKQKSPFELGPHEVRYFCGILARTPQQQAILGVTDYIGGSHSYLYDLVLSRLDEGAHFLWGGELMFVGTADAGGVGHLLRANETSGWLHFLRDKPHVQNDIAHLKRFLMGARELPFEVSPQVELLSFDPKRQHLVEEANQFLEINNDNLRHCLNSRTAVLRMLFRRFLRGRCSAAECRQELSEGLRDRHEVVVFLLDWIQKYYPDHAQMIGSVPSLEQIHNSSDAELKNIIELYQQTLKNLYKYANRSTYQLSHPWNNVTHGDYDFYEIDQKKWWEELGL